MMLCAIWLVMFRYNEFDYFILDQVSFPIPILKLCNSKIMFYCHFPDKLLSTNRGSFIMRFYRWFLDFIEEITTGMAQTIVVNSGFTRQIFEDNFPIISAKKENEQPGWVYNTHYPKILYPPINLKTFEKTPGFK
jgi:alpha-1,3/alpha-1,6-mannosyltransferase